MKNIAIFGSARSGKSTLAKMISKKFPNYHIIIGDDIRWAFQEILPELNINSNGGSGMKKIFPNFIASYFYKSIKRNNDEIGYIVETCDITPKKAKELFDKDNTILVFLITPGLTIEEHLKEIRKYETEKDWTYGRSEEYMKKHCTYWIQKSVEYEKECQNLDIWYVDTSFDRDLKLQQALKKIEKRITKR